MTQEGERQHALAARNTASVGQNFVAAGFEVTVADVVTAEALREYRAELPDCVVVHLRITLRQARHRARTRKVYITDEEFELSHALMKSPPDVDLVLDVNGMTVDEQITSIRDAWRHFSDATR
jgi:hypothetical protein